VNAVKDPDLKLLVLVLSVVVLGGAFWFFREDIFPPAPEPVVVQPEPAEEKEPAKKEPIHPIASPEMSMSREGELVPLPPLDDSDSYFLLALIDLFGSGVEPVLVREALVDKFVTTVDNLTRSHVAEKVRPVGRLSGAFTVDATADKRTFELSNDNFARYDHLVDMATNADIEAVVAMYRRFYPLFQESYERLGYPDGYFNDRVVEVTDHLLATPVIEEPVRLLRPHVLYKFADPNTEALSSGQKLLIRMGPVNAERMQEVLRRLRFQIARTPT